MATEASYPLRVEAELEPRLSRWLWLVKWFLAIPHFIVLGFLWIAFSVLTLVAFFAILFTGRYPRSIFEFNVGVMRWTWRVSDYAYGVLGTDAYPPFTLEPVPGYPARLEVAYPEHLSRGLVLVKWFLAIPHLIIVGILASGGTWLAWNADHLNWGAGGGLIGLLVLVAAVILAVTGTYPRQLFDLILGLNRWTLRVAAYVSLMTDRYPPFRLDMGGNEPGGVGTLTIPAPPSSEPGPTLPAPPPSGGARRGGWTGGRITAVAIGSLLALVSFALFAGGGFLLWAFGTQRDAQGFYSTPERTYQANTYALITRARVTEPGPGWFSIRGGGWLFGAVSEEAIRIRVNEQGGGNVFVGVAPSTDVDRYLSGVARTVVTDLPDPDYRSLSGSAPAGAPSSQAFWEASATGAGTRSLRWDLHEGSWTIVVMNADGSRGIDIRADAGARVPALPWIAAGLLIAIPVSRANRSTRRGGSMP